MDPGRCGCVWLGGIGHKCRSDGDGATEDRGCEEIKGRWLDTEEDQEHRCVGGHSREEGICLEVVAEAHEAWHDSGQ